MSTTLYKHRIFCLHGTTGQITADVNSSDTTFSVQQAVIDDVTIAIGSNIYLDDGTNTSNTMTITAIDDGSDTLTVDTNPGYNYLSATPTNVVRSEHWAYKWTESATELTTCPENPSHSVRANSMSTVESISENRVIIDDGVVGRFQISCVEFDIPSMTPGDIHTEDVSFPFDMELYKCCTYTSTSMIGDRYSIKVSPDTPISTLSAIGATGATGLTLDQAIFSAGVITKGIHLTITDGTPQLLGRVTAYDNQAHTITIQTALTKEYGIGSGILLNLYLVHDIYIPDAGHKNYGSKGFKPSYVPANTLFRLEYTNVDGTAKKLLFNIEYNYS